MGLRRDPNCGGEKETLSSEFLSGHISLGPFVPSLTTYSAGCRWHHCGGKSCQTMPCAHGVYRESKGQRKRNT